MRTSRTAHAIGPAPKAHRPHHTLVASRRSAPRGRAHLRVVPDVPATPRPVARPAPSVRRPAVRRPAPRPAAPARPAPIRLTRRGRIVVVLFLVAALLVAGWFVSRAVADAATTGSPPTRSVVARPGDTLWSIAVRARPDADPRVTVGRIIDVNGLATPVVQPGQRLILPRS